MSSSRKSSVPSSESASVASGLQEELERKLYEQINITNTMSRNWKEAITQFAAMREDLALFVSY
jgi:hypothetical protein